MLLTLTHTINDIKSIGGYKMAVYQEFDKNGKLIKTKDGRSWVFRVPYIDEDGIRQQKKSKRYMTSKIAKDEERKFLNNIEAKEQVDKSNWTFKDLYTSYYDYKTNIEKVKDTTFDTYYNRVPHLQYLDNVKLSEFNIEHFNKWKKKIDAKPELKCTSTKNDIFKFLKAILNYGSKQLNFDFSNVYNKMTNFTDPNEMPREMEFYTYDEFKHFISFEDDLKYICIFETLYYMGCRKGELRGLTWDKIDFINGLLKINIQVPTKYGSKEYKFTSVKTKSSIRTLPIPEPLLTHLKSLYEEVKQYKNFNRKWFVFGSKEYGYNFPIASKEIDERNNYIANLADIKRIRPHDFRHSCASLLINSGANVTIVAKYLGHTKVEETLNTYTHMFDSALDQVLDVINTLEDKVDLNNLMTTSEILENIHELTNIDKNIEISLTEKQDIFHKLQKYLKLMEINIKN